MEVNYAGLPRKAFPRKQAFGDISVFLWLQKQQLRFAQGQPKHFFQMKEVDRTPEVFARMNVEWKVEKAQYAEFKVPICGNTAGRQPCRDRQIQSLFQNASLFSTLIERRRRQNANMHQYVPLRASMGQYCSLLAVQRKRACAEQSWWPEFDVFWSMPWCSFPWHKLLPRLAQKNYCTVYRLSLFHELTSFFDEGDFCRFA